MKRSQENELYFMRAFFKALLSNVRGMLDEKRGDRKSKFMVSSEPVRVSKGLYVTAIVVGDKRKNTTLPYLELFSCSESELSSEFKEIQRSVISNVKDCHTRVVCDTDESITQFKADIVTEYNDLVDEEDEVYGDAFSGGAGVNPTSILSSIIKNTMEDLDEVIEDELSEDDKENFRRSRGKFRNSNSTFSKDGRKFTSFNGIEFSIKGYDEDDDSYEDIDISLSYKIKREVKADGMYD